VKDVRPTGFTGESLVEHRETVSSHCKILLSYYQLFTTLFLGLEWPLPEGARLERAIGTTEP
jgi:hypothetical protein